MDKEMMEDGMNQKAGDGIASVSEHCIVLGMVFYWISRRTRGGLGNPGTCPQ